MRLDLTVTGIAKGQGEENPNETLAELRNVSDINSINVLFIGFGEPEGVLGNCLSCVEE